MRSYSLYAAHTVAPMRCKVTNSRRVAGSGARKARLGGIHSRGDRAQPRLQKWKSALCGSPMPQRQSQPLSSSCNNVFRCPSWYADFLEYRQRLSLQHQQRAFGLPALATFAAISARRLRLSRSISHFFRLMLESLVVVARLARPMRCTLPMTPLRVTPPSRLAMWLALSPSAQLADHLGSSFVPSYVCVGHHSPPLMRLLRSVKPFGSDVHVFVQAIALHRLELGRSRPYFWPFAHHRQLPALGSRQALAHAGERLGLIAARVNMRLLWSTRRAVNRSAALAIALRTTAGMGYATDSCFLSDDAERDIENFEADSDDIHVICKTDRRRLCQAGRK